MPDHAPASFDPVRALPLRSLLDESGLAAMIVGPEGIIRYASRAAERQAGSAPLTGRRVADLIGAVGTSSLFPALGRVVDDGEADSRIRIALGGHARLWRARHDKESGCFLLTEAAGADPRPVETAGSMQAILDLKRILDHSSAMFYAKDASGRFRMANDLFCSVIGVPFERLIGKTDHDVLPRAFAEKCRREDRAVVATGNSMSFEDCFIDGGVRRFFQTVKFPLMSAPGEPVGVAGLSTDVTDLRRIQEDLEISKERFSLAVRGTQDGIWDWDIVRNRRYVSPRYVEMLGYETVPDVDAFEWWQSLVHEDDVERARQAVIRFIEGVDAVYECEYRMRCADGRYRWILARGAAIRGSDGKATRMVGFNSDITERRIREQELRQAHALAEEASRAKSEFLAHMSHELRTPLNAVIGFSETMKLGVFGDLAPRYREYATHIHDSGQYLLSIITDILDFSKAMAGKIDIQDVPTDLAAIAGRAAKMMAGIADKASVRLDIASSGDPLVFLVDEQRVVQALLNLISNAIRYTDTGGAVRIETTARPNGGAGIAVIDSGCGMTEDEIKIARTAFGQVRGTSAAGRAGTGLGLPLAEKFMKLHGGELTIESRPGLGTRVELGFPAHRRSASQSAAASPPRPAA